MSLPGHGSVDITARRNMKRQLIGSDLVNRRLIDVSPMRFSLSIRICVTRSSGPRCRTYSDREADQDYCW